MEDGQCNEASQNLRSKKIRRLLRVAHTESGQYSCERKCGSPSIKATDPMWSVRAVSPPRRTAPEDISPNVRRSSHPSIEDGSHFWRSRLFAADLRSDSMRQFFLIRSAYAQRG